MKEYLQDLCTINASLQLYMKLGPIFNDGTLIGLYEIKFYKNIYGNEYKLEVRIEDKFLLDLIHYFKQNFDLKANRIESTLSHISKLYYYIDKKTFFNMQALIKIQGI